MSKSFKKIKEIFQVSYSDIEYIDESYFFLLNDSSKSLRVTTSPRFKISQGDFKKEGDCVVKTTDLILYSILNGQVSAQDAFLSSDIRIEGTKEQALKLNLIFEYIKKFN